jgi:hypothetical protein
VLLVGNHWEHAPFPVSDPVSCGEVGRTRYERLVYTPTGYHYAGLQVSAMSVTPFLPGTPAISLASLYCLLTL